MSECVRADERQRLREQVDEMPLGSLNGYRGVYLIDVLALLGGDER